MNKYLLRSVSLLLLPCLLADTASVSAVKEIIHPSPRVLISHSEVFNQQLCEQEALSPILTWFTHLFWSVRARAWGSEETRQATRRGTPDVPAQGPEYLRDLWERFQFPVLIIVPPQTSDGPGFDMPSGIHWIGWFARRDETIQSSSHKDVPPLKPWQFEPPNWHGYHVEFTREFSSAVFRYINQKHFIRQMVDEVRRKMEHPENLRPQKSTRDVYPIKGGKRFRMHFTYSKEAKSVRFLSYTSKASTVGRGGMHATSTELDFLR